MSNLLSLSIISPGLSWLHPPRCPPPSDLLTLLTEGMSQACDPPSWVILALTYPRQKHIVLAKMAYFSVSYNVNERKIRRRAGVGGRLTASMLFSTRLVWWVASQSVKPVPVATLDVYIWDSDSKCEADTPKSSFIQGWKTMVYFCHITFKASSQFIGKYFLLSWWKKNICCQQLLVISLFVSLSTEYIWFWTCSRTKRAI